MVGRTDRRPVARAPDHWISFGCDSGKARELANYQNLDDVPIAVSLASDPGNGSAFVLADNRISYTADSDFVGIDSFIYSVIDADGDNSYGAVSITVVAQNTGGTVTNLNNPAPSGGGAFGPILLLMSLSLFLLRYSRVRSCCQCCYLLLFK